jgi:hypothetical protein
MVCEEARYASVWSMNAPRPDRRHVSPADWRHIEADISIGLSPGPLESGSVLFHTLVPTERRRCVTLQYVASVLVDAEPVAGLAERLDRLLKDLSD